MEEELAHKLVDIAVETADNPALEHRCLKALSKLYTQPVTTKFILYTGAGRFMQSLKSNRGRKPVIREYADDVYTLWMRQVYSRTPMEESQQNRTPVPAINKPAPNLKPQHKARTQQNPKPKAAALIRKNKAAAPSFKKPVRCLPKEAQERSPNVPDHMRKNIQHQIFEGLNLALKGTDLNSLVFDPVGVAMLVESTLFSVWGKNCQKYRSFLYNLKDPKNPDFRRKILTGQLKPETITTLKPEDMASDEKRIQNHFIREAALNKCIVGRQAVC